MKRISSGGAYEAKIGYCRAVVAGGFVHVAGTVGQGDDVVAQCRDALATIGTALGEAGASFADVVRVTYYLPERQGESLNTFFAELAASARIIAGLLNRQPPSGLPLDDKIT